MSGRTRIILTAVAVFLACVAMYLFFVSPQRAELAEVREDVEIEEAREVQLRAELQRLQELQENAPALQAELEVIRGYVPLQPELANLIFQVQEAANAAGLDFVEITPELPRTPPEGAALAQIRATIGARGGYFALQDFVRRLYNLDRALRADTVEVSLASTEPFGTRLAMTMATRVFYEVPAPAPATATPAEPAASPTPTTTP